MHNAHCTEVRHPFTKLLRPQSEWRFQESRFDCDVKSITQSTYLSKLFEYILSHSTYKFTCKAVLHGMVVQFKTRRFEQDVRVVLKYNYMYGIVLESYFLFYKNKNSTHPHDFLNAAGYIDCLQT